MSDQPRRRSRRAVAPVTDPAARAAARTTPIEVVDPTPEPGPATLPEAVVPEPDVSPEVAKSPDAAERADSPDTTDGAKSADGAAAPAAAASSSRTRVPALALVLALVGILGLGGAGALLWRAHEVRSTDSATNLALADTPLTNEVIGQVSAGLNRIFTYDYKSPGTTEQAASSLLVGDAAGQYRTLFEALQTKAKGQQLTLTSKTLLGGVASLTPTSARLLVFLDQSSTRASDSSTATAAAQLSVAAVKQGTVWKISEIRPL